jgi:hypothetical protein
MIVISRSNKINNSFFDILAVTMYYLHDKLSLDQYLEFNKKDLEKKSYNFRNIKNYSRRITSIQNSSKKF